MKKSLLLVASAIIMSACGGGTTGIESEKHSSTKIEQTTAYFGDKENNLAVIVDVENMRLIDTIATGHQKTYALEEIKTNANKHNKNHKLYIDNRGSNAIDVFDPVTNSIIKTIPLNFHPRSIDVNQETALVAVSGVDKAMVAIIDSSSDTVLVTVGNNTITYPTTSGHSYVSSGTLASGHPHWLDREHFVLIDRQNKTISTYKLTNSNGSWSATLLNTISTPSPVHNLIPPEVHGKHGKDHGTYISTIFYATAEGAKDIYPSVLKLEFNPNNGLSIVDELEIKKDGVDVNTIGVHHLNFLKDQQHIYIGSDEGNLFIVDYLNEPMRIIKTIPAGKGAGHTAEMKHNNIAVVINHKDSFITLINSTTHTKIADIPVTNITPNGAQTQSHPQYHFSKDGRYFYLFLTEEGSLVKVDLVAKRVVNRLEIGGKLAMGTFISSH